MSSKKFKTTFAIRFFAYFSILIGVLTLIAEFGPVASAEISYRWNNLLGVRHTLAEGPEAPKIITSQGQQQLPEREAAQSLGGLSGLVTDKVIKPISTDYGLVIEKINANAKVVPDVNPADERQYMKALTEGVAEAKGSTKPGEIGNLYIFSHSTDAPWNIVRLNAIFYLLRELENGDRIVVFYKGRRYDYIVFDKAVVKGDDISYLINRYDMPVLTLQTCDPPGTILNRLVVRAKLAGT